MPTIFSHPAPILCIALACGRRLVPWRLLAAGLALSLVPDLDVLTFRYGVSYADILGHRGLSHSLVFALGAALLGALLAPWLKAERETAFFVFFAAVISHIALDAMTDGGLGVAFFWPFSEDRYFLPWQPIAVSPLSLRRFFSGRGLEVLRSEVLWVWLPSLIAGLGVWLLSLRRRAVLPQERKGF